MKKLILLSIMFAGVISIDVSFVFAEGKHTGGHHHEGAHWASPKKAAARVNPIKSNQASLDRGKQLYMTNCSSCHGATAKGDGPVGVNLNPKPTNLTIMAGSHADGDFEWKIANGRGAMPAWKASLSQNQRWDIVNYIQALENPNGKGCMSGMDHSNMSKEEMKAMMEQENHQQCIKSDGYSNHKYKKESHSH